MSPYQKTTVTVTFSMNRSKKLAKLAIYNRCTPLELIQEWMDKKIDETPIISL